MHQKNNWQSTTLGQVCDFSGGNGFREELQGRKSGDYPFIKVSDMELLGNKKEIVAANNWVDNKTRKKEAFKAFPKDSVVFAKVGAALLLNRRRILKMPTCIDNNMMAAVPKSIDSAFLFYLLSDIDFADFVQSGAVPSINQAQLSGISFDLPAPEEQHQIAAILSTIDNAIEQTEAIIAKQQRIKTGLMQDLLTRGIDEYGNIRSEETHEFKDSPLGRIPVEWDVKTLREVVCGGAQNGFFKKPELVGSGYKLINVSEIYQPFSIDTYREEVERVEATPKDLSKYGVDEGDLFFTRSSLVLEGIAHCNVIRTINEPTLFECHVIRIRPDKEIVASEFLALFCRSNVARLYLMSRAKHVTMTTISQPELEALNVPVPPTLEEQMAIVDSMLSSERTIRHTENQKNKLRSIKTALMQDLLSGKKRVTALLNDTEEITS